MSLQIINEDKASLQELLRGADDVLDHPMLRVIVEAAPSPDEAYRHITDLGWDAGIARKVRLAARARKKVPKDVWDREYVSSMRPADAMFRFGSFTPPLSKTHFTAMGNQHSTVFWFGGAEIPCDTWPFFLREFRLIGQEDLVTTVDFRGGGQLFSRSASSALEAKLWNWSGGKQPLLYAKGKSGQGSDFVIRITDANQALFYLYWPPEGSIYSQIKQMNVPGELFPRFYKAVQVERSYSRSLPGEGAEYESVRVLVRLDINPANQWKVPGGMGEAWYERLIPVSRAARAVLRLKYAITGEWGLSLDNPHNENAHLQYLGVEYAQGWPGRNAWPHIDESTELVKAMATLHVDLTKMLERAYSPRPFIPLETVAGFSLVTDPPQRLSDLFC